jgi:glutamyl-tRNA reductase
VSHPTPTQSYGPLKQRIRTFREVADQVVEELLKATDRHAPQASAHEGYAVILEELDELWEEVKKRESKRDWYHLRKEAIQVAAMALRFVVDVADPAIKERAKALAEGDK